jgi:hypothetical protein
MRMAPKPRRLTAERDPRDFGATACANASTRSGIERELRAHVEHRALARPEVVDQDLAIPDHEVLDREFERAWSGRAAGPGLAGARAQTVEVRGAVLAGHQMQHRTVEREPAYDDAARDQRGHVEVEVHRARAQCGALLEAAGLGNRGIAHREPHGREQPKRHIPEAGLAGKRRRGLRLQHDAQLRRRKQHREGAPCQQAEDDKGCGGDENPGQGS